MSSLLERVEGDGTAGGLGGLSVFGSDKVQSMAGQAACNRMTYASSLSDDGSVALGRYILADSLGGLIRILPMSIPVSFSCPVSLGR